MRKAYFLSFIYILFASISAFAQSSEPEMADVMRTNGKIYVVVLVLATIFAGIVVYLISLDRKISRLEKNSK
ncbi:MAG: CcmD family protein [Sphingobacteriales bacterium]|nr:MAG: CcmD family protein [Sphingobacteriales bacterium]